MNQITDQNLKKIYAIRHNLHQIAEISGEEKKTAKYIEKELKKLKPDHLESGIGGYGIIATFEGSHAGPELLFRAELDALPIPETLQLEYGSQKEGQSHKCGHDGHMAIVMGLAAYLSQNRPEHGKVHVMFQSAEETGEGAQWMLDDKKLNAYTPDYVFALHNLPGYPKGSVILREDVFASASVGFIARLEGQTSHAGHPEDGNSPAPAISSLIDAFNSLPSRCVGLNKAGLVTVIHARLGKVAFGTTPGEGEVMATLRAHYNEDLDRMIETAQAVSQGTADAWGLDLKTDFTEGFRAVINNSEANALIQKSSKRFGEQIITRENPFPWSEDFGRFTEKYNGALFGLGAGEKQPQLHSRKYDFPDEIIPDGVAVFTGIVDEMLNE